MDRFIPDLIDEYARLHWLSGHLPVPAIRAFVHLPEATWLLTDGARGRPAEQIFEEEPARREELTLAVVRFMQRIHALPTAECPFEAGMAFRLAAAERNVAAGRVDEDDFDPERLGWTARQVFDKLQDLLPLAADRVVTHGDFSLGNLLIEDGEVSGCIDVGRAGVADRYQDLAIFWNCLRDYEPGLPDLLWKTYGIDEPDEIRLKAHLLLDELF